MKLIKNSSLLIVLLFTAIGFSQTTTLTQAINIAGKQRMLGQRMAKNKIYIKANKKTDFALKELNQSFNDFKKGLKILNDFAPTEIIKNKVAIQAYTFEAYKKEILDTSEKSIKEVIASNTVFLSICEDLVATLINYSETLPKKNGHEKVDKIAKATGSSGKLRYLTQRLTLYYSMNEYGFQDVTHTEINTIIKQLDSNLKYLNALDFNTTKINNSLNLVNNDWNKLKPSLDSINPKKINAVLLYEFCNAILKKANTTTEMYANLK